MPKKTSIALNISPPLEIPIERKPTGNLRLAFDYARFGFVLRIPYSIEAKELWGFVRDKQDWLVDVLQKHGDAVALNHGAIIPVFGRNRTIRVVRRRKGTTDIRLTNNSLVVVTADNNPGPAIQDFLSRKLYDDLYPKLVSASAQLRKKPGRLIISQPIMRWGSCTTDGDIRINWRLVFAPAYVRDYVLKHEIAHRRHFDHGSQFWSLCQKLEPQTDRAKTWLKKNRNNLYRYRA